jgi:hypothetical protein
MPNIAQYRNKVGAHFSIVNPYAEDKKASQFAGLMTNVIYAKGRFYIGAFSPSTIDGKEVEKSNIPCWSITVAHGYLVKRFWPDGRPKSYNSLPIPGHESLKIDVKYDTGP